MTGAFSFIQINPPTHFSCNHRPLAGLSPTVVADNPGGVYHPMTRDDKRDRVGPDRITDRAGRVRLVDPLRELLIAEQLPLPYAEQGAPDLDLKIGSLDKKRQGPVF